MLKGPCLKVWLSSSCCEGACAHQPLVFVGNLAFKTTEEDLAKAFAVHGEVYVFTVFH